MSATERMNGWEIRGDGGVVGSGCLSGASVGHGRVVRMKESAAVGEAMASALARRVVAAANASGRDTGEGEACATESARVVCANECVLAVLANAIVSFASYLERTSVGELRARVSDEGEVDAR